MRVIFIYFFACFCVGSIQSKAFDGRYVNIDGDSIYYKISGTGEAIVFLHGGLYGSVDDFDDYSATLSNEYTTISVSTRGYYKSDIGSKVFSYQLFADDVMYILKKEKIEKATIVGYSDGAITAYRFAASYPEMTNVIIPIAGALNRGHYKSNEWIENIDSCRAIYERPDKIGLLLANMKKPQQFEELIRRLKLMWNNLVYTSYEDTKKMTMPVLIVGGDRDDFFGVDSFVEIYNLLPNAQLLIMPNTTHKIKTIELLNNHIMPFIKSKLK